MLDDKQGRIRVVVPNVMGGPADFAAATYHAFFDPAAGNPKPDDGRAVEEGLRADFVWPAGTSGYTEAVAPEAEHKAAAPEPLARVPSGREGQGGHGAKPLQGLLKCWLAGCVAELLGPYSRNSIPRVVLRGAHSFNTPQTNPGSRYRRGQRA